MRYIIPYAVMFLIASATGCGIGSAGLLVVYLTLVCGFDQKTAQAQNLVFFIIAASSSLFLQIKKYGKIRWRAVILCSLAAIPGILLGTSIRESLSDGILRLTFGILLVIVGLIVMLKCLIGRHGEK